MFGCLILFLYNTIKYLEVKDLTLTMIVVIIGLTCFMVEFTFGGVCVCKVGV